MLKFKWRGNSVVFTPFDFFYSLRYENSVLLPLEVKQMLSYRTLFPLLCLVIRRSIELSALSLSVLHSVCSLHFVLTGFNFLVKENCVKKFFFGSIKFSTSLTEACNLYPLPPKKKIIFHPSTDEHRARSPKSDLPQS